MKKSIGVFLKILLLGSLTFAADISPLVKLNVASKKIRGTSLSLQERELALKAHAEGKSKEFYEKTLKSFLRSPEHAKKMSHRLDELFRFKGDVNPISEIASLYAKNPDSYTNNTALYSDNNSANKIFKDLVLQNQSWDTLLTGKKYTAYLLRGNEFFSYSDWGFFSALRPDLRTIDGIVNDQGLFPDLHGKIISKEIQFSDKDPRIAGSLTTARFFNRYVNTGLNKNRKRAAAIFRIFLCDNMAAAIPSSEGKEDGIYDLMFPHGNFTEEDLQNAMNEADALHGSDEGCLKCHYKLDPMGKSFMTSSAILSPKANRGRLTYKKANGNLVDVATKGIGELATAITQQDEYASCQVRNFWNWYMPDFKLSTEKEKELVGKFNAVGRKTNDFIEVLSQQPEFYSASPLYTEEQLMARSVKSFLQRCQDCHKDQDYYESPDGRFPDFTIWPIGGTSESMTHWLQLISKALDLAHDGENPKMPPSSANWRATYGETQLIKNWILKGAPGESGSLMQRPGVLK